MRQDFVLRRPLEGERHPIGLEAAGPELIDQLADQQLGAPPDKRHLGFADENGSDAQGKRQIVARRVRRQDLGEQT